MKKRRILAVLMIVALAVASFSGCGKKKEKEEPKKETKQVVQEEEEPEEVEEEPEVNQETFAIFGVDSRENNLGKGTRSDSLMVVNVDNTNKKCILLLSIEIVMYRLKVMVWIRSLMHTLSEDRSLQWIH